MDLAFFFGFRGRINRAKYWLAMLIFFIAAMMLVPLGLVFGKGAIFHLFSYPLNLAIFVSSLAVSLKRLHDRDRSAWWLFAFYIAPGLFAVPALFLMWAATAWFGDARDISLFLLRLCLIGAFALAIWGMVEIGFLRGTTGYNRFGPDPLARRPRTSAAAAPALR